MKGDGDGKASKNKVRGVVEKIAPALERTHRPFQHDPHGFERIFADDQNDKAGKEERHDQIEQRDQAQINPGWKFAASSHQAASSVTPAINRPSSRSLADES